MDPGLSPLLAIEKLRESDPGQYVRMIVSILPKRVENRRAELLVERLPDEELARIIRETRQVLASVEIDIDEEEQTQ
jgi:ribulose bisphosphate carboxylase small subunit